MIRMTKEAAGRPELSEWLRLWMWLWQKVQLGKPGRVTAFLK
jgi:hypothetical protein